MDFILALFCFSVSCVMEVNDSDGQLMPAAKERDFITLHTDVTETEQNDHLLWMLGAPNIHTPEGYEWIISMTDSYSRLTDQQSRLHTVWNFNNYRCGATEGPQSFFRARSLTHVRPDQKVSVMKGDSVTLHTEVTELQEGDLWKYAEEEIHIAQVTQQYVTYDDKFKDRLELNRETGSFTIKNIRTTDSGNYECNIFSRQNIPTVKCFTVMVHDSLPVPVITRDSSHCSSSSERSSSSRCVLVCSVMNVTRVTLSWYKEHSLISSISASDLNIRLSLPLEVEYQDTNTYSCVLNNPIRNQTQHLSITDVCQPCPDFSPNKQRNNQIVFVAAAAAAVVGLAVIVAGIIWCWRTGNARQWVQKLQSCLCLRNHNNDVEAVSDDVSIPLAALHGNSET